jgi:hypothetical protein
MASAIRSSYLALGAFDLPFCVGLFHEVLSVAKRRPGKVPGVVGRVGCCQYIRGQLARREIN